MIEYEELRNDIDRYLMECFKYRKNDMLAKSYI